MVLHLHRDFDHEVVDLLEKTGKAQVLTYAKTPSEVFRLPLLPKNVMTGGQPKRILGIDPGLNTTGYGVIDVQPTGQIRLIEAGIIRSRPKDTMESRLAEIHSGVTEVLQAHLPELMALEQLFSHYDRPRTAILMGHARGVICLAAKTAGIPLRHFEPTKVKKVLTGNGRAPKHQMQLAVKVQLGLTSVPEPSDVADALAIALCGHHLGNQPMLEKLKL